LCTDFGRITPRVAALEPAFHWPSSSDCIPVELRDCVVEDNDFLVR
jgi:hypothetical protein